MSETVDIAIESPGQEAARALLAAGDAVMAALYPAESNHMLDVESLLRPEVTFLLARRHGVAVGCGALVQDDGFAEVKRLFVAEEARGTGLGARLLKRLEEIALQAGHCTVRLETGVRSLAALRLYERAGYERIPPFGGYVDDPLSVFLEKALP